MMKQVIRLCRLQLGNLFGLNVIIHTKDKKKKKKYIGLSFAWLMLIAVAVIYVVAFSFGLASMGMTEIIPMYLYTVTSILVLVFSFLKAGNTLFSMKGYEMLISLPVSKASIIISRFLSMYVMDLLMDLLIMIPGLVVYAFFEIPDFGFYLVFFVGSLFLPLLPLTISCVIGAIITAISSRSRHKSIVETLLMLGFTVVVLGGSLILSDGQGQLTEEMLMDMANLISQSMGAFYPPSVWFQHALSGSFRSLLLLLGVPTLIFTIFVAVLQKYFQSVCAAIHAFNAKNNYKMTRLQKNSHLMALWKKEIRRYFASSIYVTNTIICYAMAVLLSVAILAIGVDQVLASMGIPDLGPVIQKCLPFGLAFLFCMTSITACSISMEGNTFWQIQSLPVSTKEYYDSKIVTQLSVALPFYIVCVLLLSIAVKPSFFELIWIILIPLCYLLFSSVSGITVNLLFPVLKWENEVSIVKQSASMMVTMLFGFLACVIPLFAMIFLGAAYSDWVCVLTIVIIGMTTLILYKRNQKTALHTIEK